MSQPISLVLIDDNRASRERVVARIREQPGFHVLAASGDLEEALRTVRECRPDIVLLDLGHDELDRLTLAGALHGEVPESRVIIMGLAPFQEDVVSLVRAGVSGFTMAGASFDKFLRTIHSVAQGSQVLPLELTHSLFAQLNRHGGSGGPTRTLDIKHLTDREQKVADLIVQGLSNKEIAAQMRIGLRTAKGLVHKILSKLPVNCRLEVAAFSQNGAGPAIIPGRPRLDSMARTWSPSIWSLRTRSNSTRSIDRLSAPAQ